MVDKQHWSQNEKDDRVDPVEYQRCVQVSLASAARKAGSPSFGLLNIRSNMTRRAPAPNKRSSKRTQSSRDHGNGRSVINSKARLPAISSGPTAFNCNDC